MLLQPPPSTTDRIAKYTHLYPAGMFNRPYDACTFENARGAGAYFAYDAPDVVPSGARFERVVALSAAADRLVVDERFTPRGDDPRQRLVSLSALAAFAPDDAVPAGHRRGITRTPLDRATEIDPRHGGVDRLRRRRRSGSLVISWRPATSRPRPGRPRRATARCGWCSRRAAGGASPTRSREPETAAAQRAFIEAERAWAAANPAPASESGEVAKRYTQSPQKRPSESSCGFESHLPQ